MKQTMEKSVTEESKTKYLEALKGIRTTAPECKIKEVDDMIKLVQNLRVSKEEREPEDMLNDL
jgi:hypothetical protein